MRLLPFLLITVLWVLFFLIRTFVRKRWRWNLCPICSAVSITWMILVVLWILGRYNGTLEIGILMGMTISGLLSLLEKTATAGHLRHLGLAKPVLVIGGFAAVWSFLANAWTVALTIGVITILALAMILFLLSPAGQKKVATGLDDCC